MKTIWKYPLKVVDDQIIYMPLHAEILTIQMQNDIPCLWALVSSIADKEKRHIRIHGTGHQVSLTDKLKYISTFQMNNGLLVFHVFEVID